MVSLLGLRAAVLSLLLFGLFIGVWHLATSGTGTTVSMDPEYAKLVGASASQGKSAMPGPAEVGAKIWEHLKNPFYDRGSNDKGVGIQLAFSIARVAAGYLVAVAVAVPIGFLIGMSPLMSRALDPFIQVLRPISPLAWGGGPDRAARRAGPVVAADFAAALRARPGLPAQAKLTASCG